MRDALPPDLAERHARAQRTVQRGIWAMFTLPVVVMTVVIAVMALGTSTWLLLGGAALILPHTLVAFGALGAGSIQLRRIELERRTRLLPAARVVDRR